MIQMSASEAALLSALRGTPLIDTGRHVRAALREGCSAASLVWDVIRLLRGPGRLSPPEYFYFRLWNPQISASEKLAFVGKKAQHLMHVACNDRHWYQTAADKILFHTIMAGAQLPVPPIIGITQSGRTVRGAAGIDGPEEIASLLRDPAIYPLFAKPAAGKYSLNVISAESYDLATDSLVLLGGARQPVLTTAQTMAAGAGYVLQPRPQAADEIEAMSVPSFGLRGC